MQARASAGALSSQCSVQCAVCRPTFYAVDADFSDSLCRRRRSRNTVTTQSNPSPQTRVRLEASLRNAGPRGFRPAVTVRHWHCGKFHVISGCTGSGIRRAAGECRESPPGQGRMPWPVLPRNHAPQGQASQISWTAESGIQVLSNVYY